MSKRRTGRDQVHSITSTQTPLGEDIDRRARRYLAQMAVRTVCFLGATLTWGRVPTWLSVTLLVGAVVLPYVAVVLANAGRERPERADSPLELREIGGGPVPGSLGAPDAARFPGPADPWYDVPWSAADDDRPAAAHGWGPGRDGSGRA